ncbi:hypothetical protein KP509_11G035600 [Ceratopteris richardii]|uniref:Mechanosensitive ion channel MscS domain-containing protein n=1 Tax=Ceratopteris richardii TaxID=49495 RepID=A0A8T2TU94_CERRI|nr:hypothetical protein KP509_11G035600 [Ceratopteris richardii]
MTISTFLQLRSVFFPLRSRHPRVSPHSGFSGQKLRHSKVRTKENIQVPSFLCKMQLKKDGNNLPSVPIEDDDHFLDDLSHWISKKVSENVRPLFPEDFDILNWIPDKLHSRIHSVERAAAVFVRECLVLAVVALLFARVGKFCRWLSSHSNAQNNKKQPETYYEDSVYHAMEDPLRAGLLVWQLTRSLKIIGPLFKLNLTPLMVEKVRSFGYIISITWFLFKWKGLILKHLISENEEEKPRFVALDKILSLLMYYVAGTCMGEVFGYAFRSVLAIGGISGIAVGFASKEIVGNFLAGALLFITRPFVIGDYVKAKSFEGHVQDIGFLYSKIIGFDQSPARVPNSSIMNEIIVNYSRAKCRQLSAVFLLRNEDIVLVDKIANEITDLLSKHERVDLKNGRPPLCYLKSMSPEGLELELSCCIKHKGLFAFQKAKHDILIKAAQIVTSSGACFESNVPVLLLSGNGKSPSET